MLSSLGNQILDGAHAEKNRVIIISSQTCLKWIFIISLIFIIAYGGLLIQSLGLPVGHNKRGRIVDHYYVGEAIKAGLVGQPRITAAAAAAATKT